jgi:hypothetical protein
VSHFEVGPLSEVLSMTMPSAQRYRGFLVALRKNVRAFNSAENDEQRLAAALAVLQGLVLYLQGDEEIAEERLARPLGWLESAINDSAQGATVAALRPAAPGSGRPTNLAREPVQGVLAFSVELLVIGAKVPPNEAAIFVARNARGLVFSEGGDEITGEQIGGWRRELKRCRGTAGGRATFQKLCEEYKLLLKAHSASERQRCELLVRGLIKGVSVVGPRSAPNRRGKRS